MKTRALSHLHVLLLNLHCSHQLSQLLIQVLFLPESQVHNLQANQVRSQLHILILFHLLFLLLPRPLTLLVFLVVNQQVAQVFNQQAFLHPYHQLSLPQSQL